MLGIDIPIANAPMGGVVNPPLVSGLANAGAIGLVPGSLGAAYARTFIDSLGALTNRPFGMNIPMMFADPAIADTLLEKGVRLVTTSAGPVAPFTARLQAGGAKVFHVVTSLESAKRAVDAGVDGLIVEGSEGAGLRGEVSTMVLLPLITSRLDLPVVAAGGIADGVSMAAAFALGAEGVQMGTRFLASAEASIHGNFKQAVVGAAETDTMMINRHNRRPLRVLRTKATAKYEFATEGDPFKELLSDVTRLYEEGNMEMGFACVGETVGRIDEILPVADIIRRTVEEFGAVVGRLAGSHLAPPSGTAGGQAR
jgi:enoyl-[acyl-carrier protein] reductase II